MRSLQERIDLFNNSDIYPVVSSEFCNKRDVCDIVADIAEGGAKIVQIREKHLTDCLLFELIKKCKKITDFYQMLLIVNDRVDIAVAAGADGVHLGQEDLPLSEAKKIAPWLLLGVSTHNADEIAKAQAGGCGYLNIGPVFPTNTKSVACGTLGLEQAEQLKLHVRSPFSVMGGIKEKNIPLLVSKGFNHIAMVTEITQSANVKEQVKHLRNIILQEVRL